jgi:hypothetical protein
MSKGPKRKLWTTRDLQLAAAAGVLVEDFEEDFESEDEDVEVVFVSDEDFVSDAATVLLDDERLSVR